MRLFSASLLIMLAFAIYLSRGALDPVAVNESRGKIGTVKYAALGAQRRSLREITWKSATPESGIFTNDILRTDEKGELHWQSSDGTELRLAENTSIEVRVLNSLLYVKVLSGRISIHGPGAIISLKSQVTIKANNSKISIEVPPADAPVIVSALKGTAIIHFREKSVTVSANESFVIDSDPAKSHPIKSFIALEAPSDSEVLHVSAENREISLKWGYDHVGASTLKWEISKDRQFSKIIQSGQSQDGQAKFSGDVGTYFWRVLPEKGETSLVGRFLVVEHKPLEVAAHDAGAKITYREHLPLLRVAWAADSVSANGEVKYWIDVAEHPDFTGAVAVKSENVRRLKQGGFEAIVDLKKMESYLQKSRTEWYWRIGAVYGSSAEKHYSESQPVVFQRVSELEAPSLYMDTAKGDSKRFAWREVREAQEYRLFVWPAGQVRPSEPIAITRINAANIALNNFRKVGTEYEWTVVGADEQGRLGMFAKKRSFRVPASVTLSAPKIITP